MVINMYESELRKYANDILNSDNFQKIKEHIQHGNMTVNEHCINVAKTSLRIKDKLHIKCNKRDLIRGALLHDYFLYDWHFKDLKNPDSNAPAVKLTMEEFYATAVDTDYLIYNGTIDGQVSSISELEAKSELFADFKAVQNGNVWCIGKNLYQDTMDTGSIIHDFHEMLNSEDTDELTYMYKLK